MSPSEIIELRLKEREKYVWLYENSKNYGSSFYAKNALVYLKTFTDVESIVDVGTGRGEFCKWASTNIAKKVFGVDFVFEPLKENCNKNITYIKSFAHDLPFNNKSIDMITAFNVLEHLLPQDIDQTLNEFNRITKKYMFFSICYNDSKPQKWWIQKLEHFGNVKKINNYLQVNL